MTTHQIELPTKKVQDEIHEKVENAGYLLDVEGVIYKPRIDKELGLFKKEPMYDTEWIAFIDDHHIYTFSIGTFYKYDFNTFDLVSSMQWDRGLGNIVTALGDRSFGSDDEYLYFATILAGSNLQRLVKVKRSDLTFIVGPATFLPASFGYINRLFVNGDRLYITEAAGVMPLTIVDKKTLNLNTSSKVTVYGYMLDVLDGCDEYLYLASKTAASAAPLQVQKLYLDGRVVSSYTTPSQYPGNANGRLFKGDDTTIFMTTPAGASAIDKVTLQPKMLNYNSGIGNTLFYEDGILLTINTETNIGYLLDVVKNAGIGQVVLGGGLKYSQLFKINELYYGRGTVDSLHSLVILKDAFKIRHYEMSVVE